MNKTTSTETRARLSTECQQASFQFQELGARQVVADFSGGTLSTDGGVLLLRQIDAGLGVTRTLAGCFEDRRDRGLSITRRRNFLARNQLRLWLATFAYLLLERLRTLGCRGTELARSTVGTIRLKLLKVAAQITVSVRRVHVRLSSAYPCPNLFRLCQARLMHLAAPDG